MTTSAGSGDRARLRLETVESPGSERVAGQGIRNALPASGHPARALVSRVAPTEAVPLDETPGERLARLLVPAQIDISLSEPIVVEQTRRELTQLFYRAAESSGGPVADHFTRAATLLKEEQSLWSDTEQALVALLRA